MPTPETSLHHKLTQLRQRFIDQLPQRLASARAQWQQDNLYTAVQDDTRRSAQLDAPDNNPASSPSAPDMHRFFHSLKGTGRSLGFDHVANLADKAERLLSHSPAPVDLYHQIERCLTLLDEEQGRLASSDGQSKALAASNSFELSHDPSQVRSKRQRLIYLCDDEPEHVSTLVHHLICFGHEVVHFEDTESFFNAVLTRRPDAVIMDVHFPQGHTAGTETLAGLNRLTEDRLPAIVLSAYASFESRLSAVRAGCQGYFTKPVKPLDLMLAIDELTVPPEDEPLRVLVVDDEVDAADYHALLLEDAGMIVEQVHHPADALDALERFSPDLLLVDVYMPVCSGEELANIIRQHPEHLGLPIIYLSSETDSQKQLSAMAAGVEAFITKPVDPAELVSAVRLRAERLRMLRSLMSRDSMTGLYNHSTTTDLINKALAQAHRDSSEHALAMIDIDNFKQVNDTHGHLAGDQVIITLARLLKNRLRLSDITGRYGGEEFVVLLKGIDAQRAAALIDELRNDFASVNFHAGNHTFSCTFSAGLSSFPSHPATESLRLAADQALYQAKRHGRNQVMISTEPVS